MFVIHPTLRFLILLLAFTWSSLSEAQVSQEDRMGDWIGTLTVPGAELRLLVTVDRDENGQLSAVMDSLDQAPGQKIPASSVHIDTEHFEFEISAISASYAGFWNPDANRYDGQFTQGMSFPLSFARPEEETASIVDGMDGVWETTLDREGTLLRLVLNVETDENGTSVTLDSVDQAAYGLPVSGFARNGDDITFRVPIANVTYTGQLSADDMSMNGHWIRPGYPNVELRFDRTEMEVRPPNRPQTPLPPFPYESEAVRIENPETDDVVLAGTFTYPSSGGRFPAVALLSGSGPQDRDETVWTHRPFAVLADHLTRNGIAVLRFDDRGVAESTGQYETATISDFVSDARAVSNWLSERAEVNPQSVGLIGHSEGGLTAPIVAAGNDMIGFLVLLAAPGTTGQQLLLDQSVLVLRSGGRSEEDAEALRSTLEPFLSIAASNADNETLRAGIDELLTPDAMELMGIPVDMRDTAIASMTHRWYRDLLRHDPRPYLEQIDQPVLALQGELDIQVAPEANTAGLEAGLAGNRDVTIHRLDGLNHMFQTAETGAITEYATLEETFSPTALDLISAWIKARYSQ